MLQFEMDTTFEDILYGHLNLNQAVALMGEAAIGKSSFVKGMCEKYDIPCFVMTVNQVALKEDITGCRSVKETIETPDGPKEIWKQIFFPHHTIMDAIVTAKKNPDTPVVLFLDEINRTTSDVTSAILSFITERRCGSYEFPPNVRFICAGNDVGNVTALDSASLSRFGVFKVVPTASTWFNVTETVNPYIKKVLTDNPDYILCKPLVTTTSEIDGDDDDESYESSYSAFDDDAEGFRLFSAPRTISYLNDFLNKFGSQEYFTKLVGYVCRDSNTGEEASGLQALIYGKVGKTAFAEALIHNITEDLSRGMMQKANTTPKPTMPKCYKAILKCTDRQTRDNMLANLSDDEKSAVILYAVWEHGVDNSDLIGSVARQYSGNLLSGGIQPQFTTLKSNDELDPDNYAALVTSGTTLGNMIHAVCGD